MAVPGASPALGWRGRDGTRRAPETPRERSAKRGLRADVDGVHEGPFGPGASPYKTPFRKGLP